jgi:hypothetical protein
MQASDPVSTSTTNLVPEPRETPDPSSDLKLYADPRSARRSRGFAVFFFVNWVVMGWYVLRTPSSMVTLLAFALGLICLLALLGQIRGIRNATTQPMIHLDEEELHFRPFTANRIDSARLADLRPGLDVDRSHLQVTTRDGEVLDLPWLALAEQDRQTLVAALEARIAANTSNSTS